MDVQASPAELPELKEFLGSFQVRFRRPEGAEALERYTTGLLTELPNRHGDTLAQAVPGTSEQRLQEFLTTRPWDEGDLHRQRGQKMMAEATLGAGVVGRDDPGFPQQGKASVGVARQYSGPRGKVGTCQMAVTCCDTAVQASGPVAVRWYRPQTWAEDPARRAKARVPAEVTLRTTPGCWRTACGSGWSCASVEPRVAGGVPAIHFPPRPDRWRLPRPAVHREVARWLRHQALQWWVTTSRFIELCSRRL
jgi:SRSO17 transposase